MVGLNAFKGVAMATIVDLEIKNFRGINELSVQFKPEQNLVCIIGRGDSGKTTILEAISSIFSPSWNLHFSDTDFHNGDVSKNIELTATLINFPDKLLMDNKYGLFIRAFNLNTQILEETLNLADMDDSLVPALTIKLVVDSSLEPKWFVTSNREQEDKPISANDRSLLNCFLISDYIDKHFSWNRGSPLASILSMEDGKNKTDNNIVIEQLRKAKLEIDKNSFDNLDQATIKIVNQAAQLGVNISNIKTTLDSKDLLIKDGKISLHDQFVPYRLKGKGTKRLVSIAIQSILVRDGGIMLIDELEQGLEPDRAKQAVRSLSEHRAGQIFLTTHSREVITELDSKHLLLTIKDEVNDKIEVRSFSDRGVDLQKAIRACPEAFFSKKVIICEGATEIGICRAIDKWRVYNSHSPMSLLDCAYVDGTGSTIVQRVKEIHESGLKTGLFCDSDLPTINDKKSKWQQDGIRVFDCDDGLCLEQQIFKDMPWDGVKSLLEYAKSNNSDSFDGTFPEHKNIEIDNWKDSKELRETIISKFKSNGGESGKNWFKQLHHGEMVGEIIFKHIDSICDDSCLRKTLSGLSNWIDE
jgi:AAA15 family ATPase/GTPase